jgi:chaperonin GroES
LGQLKNRDMFKPLNDAIAFKPENQEEKKTESGILIPDLTKPKFIKGKVTAVGPGTESVPMTIKPGDTIVVPVNACTKLDLDGEEVMVVTHGAVLGTLE